jgi:hypothetical protein
LEAATRAGSLAFSASAWGMCAATGYAFEPSATGNVPFGCAANYVQIITYVQSSGCTAENAEENPLGASFVASNSNQVDTYQQWNNWLNTTWACDECNAGSFSTMKLESAMQLKGWKSSNGASTASQTWRLEGSMTNR